MSAFFPWTGSASERRVVAVPVLTAQRFKLQWRPLCCGWGWFTGAPSAALWFQVFLLHRALGRAVSAPSCSLPGPVPAVCSSDLLSLAPGEGGPRGETAISSARASVVHTRHVLAFWATAFPVLPSLGAQSCLPAPCPHRREFSLCPEDLGVWYPPRCCEGPVPRGEGGVLGPSCKAALVSSRSDSSGHCLVLSTEGLDGVRDVMPARALRRPGPTAPRCPNQLCALLTLLAELFCQCPVACALGDNLASFPAETALSADCLGPHLFYGFGKSHKFEVSLPFCVSKTVVFKVSKTHSGWTLHRGWPLMKSAFLPSDRSSHPAPCSFLLSP